LGNVKWGKGKKNGSEKTKSGGDTGIVEGRVEKCTFGGEKQAQSNPGGNCGGFGREKRKLSKGEAHTGRVNGTLWGASDKSKQESENVEATEVKKDGEAIQ